MNSAGPLISLEGTDSEGRTALLMALDGKHAYHDISQCIPEKVSYLLDCGADITVRDHYRRGVFHYLFQPHYRYFGLSGDNWYIKSQGHIARLLFAPGADKLSV